MYACQIPLCQRQAEVQADNSTRAYLCGHHGALYRAVGVGTIPLEGGTDAR